MAEEAAMAKVLRCSDVGFTCDATITGDSEDEIMGQAAEHARDAHGLSDQDLAQQASSIRAAIREDG
jgi:predicted small metal-binding protein